jgi:hypothetical protein
MHIKIISRFVYLRTDFQFGITLVTKDTQYQHKLKNLFAVTCNQKYCAAVLCTELSVLTDSQKAHPPPQAI